MPEKRDWEVILPGVKIITLCAVRTNGEILIVTMPVSLDHVAAMTLEKELREYVARTPRALLCDLSGTRFLSSSGLRVLLVIGKLAKAAGIRFGLFSLTKFVDRIFSMAGFTRLFAIYDTEDAAVRAMAKQ
jgi:anti-sigma B factor antagonist